MASRVLGPDFHAEMRVLYVAVHAKEMRTDLLGIIQMQAENCQIWKGYFPVLIAVISLRERTVDCVQCILGC